MFMSIYSNWSFRVIFVFLANQFYYYVLLLLPAGLLFRFAAMILTWSLNVKYTYALKDVFKLIPFAFIITTIIIFKKL